MFPQLKKVNNESGIVLFIVLMTAIIIMLFSVGVLTQSLNETNYAQQQADQIISDQLAKGIFWNAYANGALATAGPNIGIGTFNMAGRIYNATLNYIGTSGGVYNWQAYANY